MSGLMKKTSSSLLIMIFVLGLFAGIPVGYIIATTSQEGGLTLVVVYSSEKKGWVEEIYPLFMDWWHREHSDIPLSLVLQPLGSLDGMISIVSGAIQPVIWSPASSVIIPIANYLWEKEYKTDVPLIYQNDSFPTVLTPIVIGTWESYAKEHNITGFRSLHDIAVLENSDLKFAHTDPRLSNSGFLSILLEIAAASGKNVSDITLSDLMRDDVKEWIRELESRGVYYGSSTGFLLDHAVESGPESLNVFIVYENLILEKNLSGAPQAKWGQKLVAVYPIEGTLMNDHPFIILNAPWVTKEQRWAAMEFIKFLLSEDIQRRALHHGFRPVNKNVTLDEDIFNEANGISYNITCPIQNALSDGEVLLRASDVWVATRARG
ncbi:MAG: extracellular solute-binding protein [Candidatus Asgardarchaeia archaeon]